MKKDIFESEGLVKALLIIAVLIFTLEVVAMIKGVDGTMFAATAAGLGAIGGYVLKGFLKK